jgi:hypothetical protein
MKIVLAIVITLAVVAIVLYLMNKNKPVAQPILPVQQQQNQLGNVFGALLANWVTNKNNNECGKNGNPPCTTKDLQSQGYTSEQITAAQQGSQALSNFAMCQNFGIGC